MAEHFLRNLPQVREADLPQGNECGVCQEKYGKVDLHAGAKDAPVSLPCQHIIGSDCIRKWVSPDEHGKNTCPFCRYVFFSLDLEPQDPEPQDPNYQRIEALYRATLQPPGITEHDRRVARQTLPRAERSLYYELQRASAPLPALREHETPSIEQGIALFAVLVRIGAFEGLLGHMSRHDYYILWELLRRDGFVYDPNDPAMDGASGWLTTTPDSWFFIPSDEHGWPRGEGSLIGVSTEYLPMD